MQTVIRCSNEFIRAIVLAAVESYVFGTGEERKRKQVAREVYGYIWGEMRIVGEGDDGSEPIRFLHLDYLSLSLSALREVDSVEPNERFLRTSFDVMGRLAPHLHLLGDFHTHPYPQVPVMEITRQRLFDFSEADLDSFLADNDLWEATNNAPIMTVATICDQKRRTEGESLRSLDDCTQTFEVGQFRIWFTALAGYMEPFEDAAGNTQYARAYSSQEIELDLGNRFHNTRSSSVSIS